MLERRSGTNVNQFQGLVDKETDQLRLFHLPSFLSKIHETRDAGSIVVSLISIRTLNVTWSRVGPVPFYSVIIVRIVIMVTITV